MPANKPKSAGARAIPVVSADNLAGIRSFGRRGIPVIYLDGERRSISRYSRYISQRWKCPGLKKSEADFIRVLLDFGQRRDNKVAIMPANDRDVLALANHKKELEPFYYLPVPDYATVRKLVNKKLFYQMLAEMQVAHPRTYFPEDTNELAVMGREVDYPCIIKPADSLSFQDAFHRNASW
jgi:D-aspartate ligase